MNLPEWVEEFPGGVTVCDPAGTILYLNARAAQVFASDGGKRLVGASLLDCHPGASRDKLARLLETRQKNVYTIEKNGVKKLIFQSPWYQDGAYAGLIELSLEIPFDMPHFVRK